LAYPSFLLFLAAESKITHCRLIPLERGSIGDTLRRLQELFVVIAKGIERWKASSRSDARSLWETLKESLIQHNYTLYIQMPPVGVAEGVAGLAGFIEPPAASSVG